jgi:hypothetical protein
MIRPPIQHLAGWWVDADAANVIVIVPVSREVNTSSSKAENVSVVEGLLQLRDAWVVSGGGGEWGVVNVLL